MLFFPLWSGLLLQTRTHDTNAVVENWMGAVKELILRKRIRLRPPEIVVALRNSLKSRTRRPELKKTRTNALNVRKDGGKD